MIVSRTALQPNLRALWNILASGQSPHPPLNFLAVRAVYSLFGVSELTTRLPATLGFLTMEVCLFFFVSKRSNPAFGALALFCPLVTLARTYAVEAKPYGALLGWTGVSLICWRYTKVGSKGRGWALAGLAIALACATSSHFYGALLGFPLIAGEAVRFCDRKRVDWGVASAIGFNYVPLVFFIPILRASGQVHGIHPWQTQLNLRFILASWDLLLAGAAAPVMACFITAAAFRAWSKRGWAPTPSFPMDEAAAATALALLPVASFCGMRLAGIHVSDTKYLISMVVGVTILIAWSLFQTAGNSLAAGILMATIFGVWGLRDFDLDRRAAEGDLASAVHFSPPAAGAGLEALPVVVENLEFTIYERYASHGIGDRIYYVIDPELRLKYNATDAIDRSFLLNPTFFGKHVERRKDFEAEHREFLVFHDDHGDVDWMLKKYQQDGAKIEVVGSGPHHEWYLVRR